MQSVYDSLICLGVTAAAGRLSDPVVWETGARIVSPTWSVRPSVYTPTQSGRRSPVRCPGQGRRYNRIAVASAAAQAVFDRCRSRSRDDQGPAAGDGRRRQHRMRGRWGREGCEFKRKKRKDGGVRYEARRSARSSPDSSAL